MESATIGKLLFLLIPLCLDQVLRAEIVDPPEVLGKYEKAFKIQMEPLLQTIPGDMIRKLQTYMKQRELTTEEKYLIHRSLSLSLTDSTQQLEQSCREQIIRDDDYLWAAHCIEFGGLPQAEKIARMDELFQKALRNHDGTISAVRIGARLLDVLWSENDIASARLVYKTSLDAAPKNARASMMMLNWSLANVYTIPSNSRKTIEEGLALYVELEQIYRKDPDSKESADLLLFNIGDTKFTSLSDFKGALQAFQGLSENFQYWADSRIFSALSLIRLGNLKDAKKLLGEIDFNSYLMADRIPFLKCYRAIAEEELGEASDLKSCINLPPDTQTDVVLHITSELSRKNLASSIENSLWRQFWNFYIRKILPQLQNQNEKQVNAMELHRVKFESRIKDLELAKFSLLKLLFGGSIGGFLVILVFFLRLRSESKQIRKLQTYIHKSVLARFLPPVIVEEIIQGKSRIESKPREELVTVLFSDMVGFTALSGQLGAGIISEILNRFMQKMTEVIYGHQGTIDKFIGDGVMVIFGAPIAMLEKDQVENAVLCAQDMILAMKELNLEFQRDFGVTAAIRIGINQGPAIVGIFGSEKRSDFTAIGPTVNLASRIEGKAKPYEVMFSSQVAKHLAEESIVSRGLFKLKGIASEIPLYTLKTLP